MKSKIHPKYNPAVEVACACGNTFKIGSTADKINVEICSDCHPFYTGKEKMIDSTGRVDRFRQRLEKTSAIKNVSKKTEKKSMEKTPKAEKEENEKKSDKK